MRVFLIQVTALRLFSGRTQHNAAKKHCAIKSYLYADMMTSIRHFPLVISIPVFLEFHLALSC